MVRLIRAVSFVYQVPWLRRRALDGTDEIPAADHTSAH